jgi:hypothetical protein
MSTSKVRRKYGHKQKIKKNFEKKTFFSLLFFLKKKKKFSQITIEKTLKTHKTIVQKYIKDMSSTQAVQQGSFPSDPEVKQVASTLLALNSDDGQKTTSQKKKEPVTSPTGVFRTRGDLAQVMNTIDLTGAAGDVGGSDDESTVDVVAEGTKRPKVILDQGARWTATLNNPAEGEFKELFEAIKPLSNYQIWGHEGLAQGKTEHWQGYVKFSHSKRMAALKKISTRVHWERAFADDFANIKYCEKEGNTIFESGTRPVFKDNGEREKHRWDDIWTSATRNDLMAIPAQVRVNSYPNLRSIAKDHMTKPSDLDDVCGEWLYGIAGAGKSHTARAENPDAYFKNVTVWWDGYQNEESVIIDDLDKYHVRLGHLLKIWADRYSFIAETKGSAIHIRPKKIIVTSQYSIEEIWDDEETRVALNRRFKSRRIGKLPNFPIFNKPQTCGETPQLMTSEMLASGAIMPEKESGVMITPVNSPVSRPKTPPPMQLDRMEVLSPLDLSMETLDSFFEGTTKQVDFTQLSPPSLSRSPMKDENKVIEILDLME